MSRDLTLAMKLQADASRMTAGLLTGERGIKKFTSTAKREFDSIKSSLTSVEGKFASLGVTIGVTASIVQSAKLDKELKLLQLTAGGTADETARLRKELLEAQKNYGQGVDDLKGGVDALIASGLNMEKATNSVEPIARVMAVAKTNADALAKAMGVASQQFKIDLGDQVQSTLLLDKMVVSGRAGNAELENLPDIFARIGNNAKKAGLDIDQTLALTETLSLVEPNAERLGTLTDSTLRLFTNGQYLKKAQKETGIKFFDKEGSRRDPLVILAEIKKRYDSLKTSAQKFQFVSKAFGQTDSETIKGIESALDDKALTNLDRILKDIRNSSGTVARDVPDAINNAVDQVEKLKGSLREAADGFAQPINKALSQSIKFAMDKKSNGGLGMDGTDMLLAGGGAALATILTARYGGKAISGIAGKINGIGSGVATGKALETAAGVTPVYVVNMGEGGLGGALPNIPDAAKKSATAAGSFLSGSTLSTMALASGPLALMYGATKMAGDTSKDKDRASALLGFTDKLNKFFSYDPDKAQREWRSKKDQELGIIHIKVDSEGRATSTMSSVNKGLTVNMSNGPTMVNH